MCFKLLELIFEYNEYGKPFINYPTNLHLSISHSGNWITCIVDDNPVGIDVEEIKQIDFNIAERFLLRMSIKP